MHGEPELLPNPLGQGRCIQGRFLGAQVLDETQHLGGDLVRPMRPAFSGQKARQAGTIKVGLGLVESRPGDAEEQGTVGDRQTFATHPSQHLVFHLNQIPGIEEVTAGEGGVMHLLRMRIRGAVLFERGELRVGFG
jgi:hypothetical protein